MEKIIILSSVAELVVNNCHHNKNEFKKFINFNILFIFYDKL